MGFWGSREVSYKLVDERSIVFSCLIRISLIPNYTGKGEAWHLQEKNTWPWGQRSRVEKWVCIHHVVHVTGRPLRQKPLSLGLICGISSGERREARLQTGMASTATALVSTVQHKTQRSRGFRLCVLAAAHAPVTDSQSFPPTHNRSHRLTIVPTDILCPLG